MAGTWVKLEQKGDVPGARSSHAITLVGDTAYSFGGEFTPRVPVDNTMYAFDLKAQSWSALDAAGDVPPPRVGVTMASVGSTVFMFGGRDQDHKELNELYSFDTATNTWALLSSEDNGPPHRSYHSMVADGEGNKVYVFGGCGDAGRLNDLWTYDVTARRWEELPSPGEACRPRGGPGLAVTGGKVWVVYGFSGEELDDVHCYDPATREWATVELDHRRQAHPPQRVLRRRCREARGGLRWRGRPQRPRPPRLRQVLRRGLRAGHGDRRVGQAGRRFRPSPRASGMVRVLGGGA